MICRNETINYKCKDRGYPSSDLNGHKSPCSGGSCHRTVQSLEKIDYTAIQHIYLPGKHLLGVNY